MGISEENRIIAQTALKAFGDNPSVHKYWDDNHKSSIDILSVKSREFNDVVLRSTIGLSDYSMGYEDVFLPLRIEIVGASDLNCFSNVLATCAFNIINTKFECSLGSIFKDVINMYLPDSPMSHILFVSPFLWGEKLKTLDFKSKKVGWLMAVPISEAEKSYADEQGFEALEDLFEQAQINVFDLERESIL
ncbi:suppressor of fused domain protein [Mesobacillus jeotgali]|uniref:Suppressor of fused domain protein n=1 Tax=Mesobacillus jeotgali TaxID=129985 RepID=A0ABY9VFT4_9BACI|nr:suppressor of fused domain protein [Mesobacillus jeotgali]WNF22685.1 suppressor of fused domain protein [Mesobacillus jeotgali]